MGDGRRLVRNLQISNRSSAMPRDHISMATAAQQIPTTIDVESNDLNSLFKQAKHEDPTFQESPVQPRRPPDQNLHPQHKIAYNYNPHKTSSNHTNDNGKQNTQNGFIGAPHNLPNGFNRTAQNVKDTDYQKYQNGITTDLPPSQQRGNEANFKSSFLNSKMRDIDLRSSNAASFTDQLERKRTQWRDERKLHGNTQPNTASSFLNETGVAHQPKTASELKLKTYQNVKRSLSYRTSEAMDESEIIVPTNSSAVHSVPNVEIGQPSRSRYTREPANEHRPSTSMYHTRPSPHFKRREIAADRPSTSMNYINASPSLQRKGTAPVNHSFLSKNQLKRTPSTEYPYNHPTQNPTIPQPMTSSKTMTSQPAAVTKPINSQPNSRIPSPRRKRKPASHQVPGSNGPITPRKYSTINLFINNGSERTTDHTENIKRKVMYYKRAKQKSQMSGNRPQQNAMGKQRQPVEDVVVESQVSSNVESSNFSAPPFHQGDISLQTENHNKDRQTIDTTNMRPTTSNVVKQPSFRRQNDIVRRSFNGNGKPTSAQPSLKLARNSTAHGVSPNNTGGHGNVETSMTMQLNGDVNIGSHDAERIEASQTKTEAIAKESKVVSQRNNIHERLELILKEKINTISLKKHEDKPSVAAHFEQQQQRESSMHLIPPPDYNEQSDEKNDYMNATFLTQTPSIRSSVYPHKILTGGGEDQAEVMKRENLISEIKTAVLSRSTENLSELEESRHFPPPPPAEYFDYAKAEVSVTDDYQPLKREEMSVSYAQPAVKPSEIHVAKQNSFKTPGNRMNTTSREEQQLNQKTASSTLPAKINAWQYVPERTEVVETKVHAENRSNVQQQPRVEEKGDNVVRVFSPLVTRKQLESGLVKKESMGSGEKPAMDERPINKGDVQQMLNMHLYDKNGWSRLEENNNYPIDLKKKKNYEHIQLTFEKHEKVQDIQQTKFSKNSEIQHERLANSSQSIVNVENENALIPSGQNNEEEVSTQQKTTPRRFSLTESEIETGRQVSNVFTHRTVTATKSVKNNDMALHVGGKDEDSGSDVSEAIFETAVTEREKPSEKARVPVVESPLTQVIYTEKKKPRIIGALKSPALSRHNSEPVIETNQIKDDNVYATRVENKSNDNIYDTAKIHQGGQNSNVKNSSNDLQMPHVKAFILRGESRQTYIYNKKQPTDKIPVSSVSVPASPALTRKVLQRRRSDVTMTGDKWQNDVYITRNIGKLNIPSTFADTSGYTKPPAQPVANSSLPNGQVENQPAPTTPVSKPPASTKLSQKFKQMFSPKNKRKTKAKDKNDEYIARRNNINGKTGAFGFEEDDDIRQNNSEDDIDDDFISQEEWQGMSDSWREKGFNLDSLRSKDSEAKFQAKKKTPQPKIRKPLAPNMGSAPNGDVKSSLSTYQRTGVGKVTVPEVFEKPVYKPQHNSKQSDPFYAKIIRSGNNYTLNNNKQQQQQSGDLFAINSLDVNRDDGGFGHHNNQRYSKIIST